LLRGEDGELSWRQRLAEIRNVVLPSLTGPMARHSGTSLGLQLFGIGCGFLFAVAAARLLGPRGYGLMAVALSVANVAAIVALLGANGLAVREVAASVAQADWKRLRGFVRWSVITVSMIAAFAAIGIAAASFITGPYRGVLLVGAAAVPLLAALLLLRGINQGARKIVASQLPMDVVRWVFALAATGYLLAAHVEPTPEQIVAIVLFSYAVALAIAGVALHRHLRRLPEGAGTRAHGWLAASLPFLSVALLGIAATEMNTLLLGLISGPREAGLYQPLAKLSPLMLLAKDAIDMPLAPRIAELWQTGRREELTRLIQRSTLASALATAAVVTAILAASSFIFEAFGPEFETVRVYLYWIAAAQFANSAFGPSPLLLAMAGDMRRRIQAQAVTLLVQFVLTATLVPRFGVAGAVVALSLQIVTWSAVHWMFARRATGIDTSFLHAVTVRLRKNS
jgi:O-antigen/teichoic acid export membrane protein